MCKRQRKTKKNEMIDFKLKLLSLLLLVLLLFAILNSLRENSIDDKFNSNGIENEIK